MGAPIDRMEKPPNWYTFPDFLIERFPAHAAEIEADYYSWVEHVNPFPHFFLDDFLTPVLLGRHQDASSATRQEAGRVLDELLLAEDDDLASAALTSVIELLRDNPDLRVLAQPFLGPVARRWLEQFE